MLGRAVALVRGKTIARVVVVECLHHSVAFCLSYDRSGGDGEIDAIAFVEGVLWDCDARHRAGIYKDVLRRPGQGVNCPAHGEQGRVINVELVDFLNASNADAYSGGLRTNFSGK